MKRFVAVLAGLLVLPAFAEVAPLYYDEIVEYLDEENATDENAETVAIEEAEAPVVPVAQPSKVNPRSTATGRVASRNNVASTRNTSRRTTSRANTPNVTARSTTARTATTRNATPTRTSVAARVASAPAGATKQIATTRRAMQTNSPSTARASIIQTDTVNKPLYSGNRLSTRSSAVRARIPTISSLGGNTISTSTSTETDVADLDELAQATDFCKAQYIQCMDQFCNVLDENQGRCSCSKNIENYEQTELALKNATEELQNVAQQIQYIGLTADQVASLFTQTEAELELASSNDNSKISNSLNKIRDMIVDVKTPEPTSTSSTSSSFNFDASGLMDFSFDSNSFDLSALFGNTTNTASINNQRGAQLYKTAAQRCKTAILQNCQAQGVNISVITNAYDLEIDKQCVAYERSLKDANDEMVMTVRNAKSVLQRARLVVAQQKNAYNLRECVTELDNCMQDDFVCGEDYENCLDPTGKYIVNGTVVVGSTPGTPGQTPVAEANKNLYETWIYTDTTNENSVPTNAWGDGNVVKYINARLADNKNVDKMADFLVDKIGTIDTENNNKPLGMCAAILNQCQDYTYTNKEYNPDNQVIKSYLERTLIQIKSAQDAVLADYAEDCITDVAECLSENNYTYSSGYYATSNNPSNVAINACKSVIKTCQSVTGFDTASSEDTQKWLDKALGYTLTEIGQCTITGGQWKTNVNTDVGYCDCSAEGLTDATISNGRVLTCKQMTK